MFVLFRIIIASPYKFVILTRRESPSPSRARSGSPRISRASSSKSIDDVLRELSDTGRRMSHLIPFTNPERNGMHVVDDQHATLDYHESESPSVASISPNDDKKASIHA